MQSDVILAVLAGLWCAQVIGYYVKRRKARDKRNAQYEARHSVTVEVD